MVGKNKVYDPVETEEQIEEFEKRINTAISDFCHEQCIDNIQDMPQNIWTGCLRYIFRHVFRKELYINNPDIVIPDSRYNSILDYNNIDLLKGILDYYIYLCDIYNKVVNIYGFSYLIGLEYISMYDWINGNKRTNNPEYANMVKTLYDERERSLSDRLNHVKNPVGTLAQLNRWHGWNLPGTSREIKHVATTEAPETIAARYRSRLSSGQNGGLLSDNSGANDSD